MGTSTTTARKMEELDKIMPALALVEAVNPSSFAVSTAPLLLGSALGAWDGHFDISCLCCALALAVCVQATANVLLLKRRMESPHQHKKDHSVLDHPLTPKQLHQVLLALGALSLLLALQLLCLAFLRALPLLALTAAAGYVFAVDPFNWGRHAAGDLMLALLAVPALCESAYVLQAASLAWKALPLCLPLCSLTLALLHVQNGRFVGADSRASLADARSVEQLLALLRGRVGRESLSQIVGSRHSTQFLRLLLYGANALVFVFSYVLTFWLLLPLCCLPVCHGIVVAFHAGEHKELSRRCCLLLLLFGALYAASFFLAGMRTLHVVGLLAFLALCVVVFFLSDDIGSLFDASSPAATGSIPASSTPTATRRETESAKHPASPCTHRRY